MPLRVVEPPTAARGRRAGIDEKELNKWAQMMTSNLGQFISGDEKFDDLKKARYAATKLKNQLVQAEKLDASHIRARAWQDKRKFVFALSFDPEGKLGAPRGRRRAQRG